MMSLPLTEILESATWMVLGMCIALAFISPSPFTFAVTITLLLFVAFVHPGVNREP